MVDVTIVKPATRHRTKTFNERELSRSTHKVEDSLFHYDEAVSDASAKILSKMLVPKVRSIFQLGKLAQIVNEFLLYKLDILGRTEAIWCGKLRFAPVHL